MSPATHKLHLTLIRQVKGIVSAWETWLREIVAESDQKATGTQQGRATESPRQHDASRKSGETPWPSKI